MKCSFRALLVFVRQRPFATFSLLLVASLLNNTRFILFAHHHNSHSTNSAFPTKQSFQKQKLKYMAITATNHTFRAVSSRRLKLPMSPQDRARAELAAWRNNMTQFTTKEQKYSFFKDHREGYTALLRTRQQRSPQKAEETHSVLERYAPRRVPGYIASSSKTYFGFVMRDLVTRILSREIASSHVLVVIDQQSDNDIDEKLKYILSHLMQNNSSNHDAAITNEQRQMQQQQEEEYLRKQINYSVGGSVMIHAKRQGHDLIPLTSNSIDHHKHSWPSWVLFAFYDVDDSDSALQRTVSLLQQSTVTYIVIKIAADVPAGPRGRKAVEILLQHKYKVQVLSLSHFSTDWRPNTLLTRDNVDTFFDWVQKTTTTKRKKTSPKNQTFSQPLRGYLFATQGFDMAIPSRKEYIQLATRVGVDYKQCVPTTGNKLRVIFDPTSPQVYIFCGKKMLNVDKATNDTEIWFSNNKSMAESEAICVRAVCKGQKEVACAARILDRKRQVETTDKNTSNAESTRTTPNLLVLMLDPISRARFARSLPRTFTLLDKFDFVRFTNYTAVGNNSGPNQAALYSGRPLQHRDSLANHSTTTASAWLWESLREAGYATLKAEDGCIENSNMIQSLRPQVDHGDAFLQMMCFDFHRPNCLGSKSGAKHLVDYATDFIRHYSSEQQRQPWAALLHFIDSHEDSMAMEGTIDEILWRFLFFLRTQHQVGRAGAFPETIWKNTMIVVISDHGLHYGSYFLSPQGRRERSEPILYVKPPESTAADQLSALHFNKNMWTTPFDVYKTIFDVLLRESKDGDGESLMKPLLPNRHSCHTTIEIPSEICDLLSNDSAFANSMIPNPPSILSFYADIPKEEKMLAITEEGQRHRLCRPIETQKFFLPGQECNCATSHQPWYSCSAPPVNVMGASETFLMVDCNGMLHYETRIQQNPAIVERVKARLDQTSFSTSEGKQLPNILFIEVDSVSFAHADRHLPKTRDLLLKHRVHKEVKKGSVECYGNLCSAEFPYFSVTGPNSIANQVAVFSGCIVATGEEVCTMTTFDASGFEVCLDTTKAVNGLYLANTFRNSTTWCPWNNNSMNKASPWIFDFAKSAGYVSLFAEEFCYDDSPYVAQGNIFNLTADIHPHRAFCRLVERQVLRDGVEINRPLWNLAESDPTDLCLDGPNGIPKTQVALEHIEKMWDAYAEYPKLAFVNAMAAHDYEDDFAKTTYPLEEYDEVLSAFLQAMLERPDASNTVIVVRGDHGLQGGPNTMEYSIQVEALRPWTEIIVPASLPGISLDALFKNQRKLTTGWDLNRVLVDLVTAENEVIRPKPSEWSYNLIAQEVPDRRTCDDAKVPRDVCLFESQRHFTAPNLKTCNAVEPLQFAFCPDRMHELRDSMSETVLGEFIALEGQAKLYEKLCQREEPMLPDSVKLQWHQIDSTVQAHPKARVSGGIFLYPRQSVLLHSIVHILGEWTNRFANRRLHVCETGFGAGHSSSLFLEASPNVVVHSFDKFDRPYQDVVAEDLNRSYSGRLHTYQGDSCELVPKSLNALKFQIPQKPVRCDFLHGSSLCPSDNMDLVMNSPCGVILTTTAMDSINESPVYFGRKGQWKFLREMGCIKEITCFREESLQLDRNYVFNKNGTSISHKFCVAVTTGMCQQLSAAQKIDRVVHCDTAIAKFASWMSLPKTCRKYQIPVPA